ncbi:MAG: hypothetical protein RQ756_05055, partial [Flavobacteriaceae bacterium]|nr:hypothetical protein [Flavobacteriaceae bacterium]
MTTSFRFYNLVISSDSTYTTAKLKEYIMTPTFHNALMANLVTMSSFEGVVLSQTLFTDNPCPPEDRNLVIGNPNAISGGGIPGWIDFGDVDPGPNSGTNWSSFFGGPYNGYSGGGTSSGSDGLVELVADIGTAIGDAVSNFWSWLSSLFPSGSGSSDSGSTDGCECSNKNTLVQASGTLLVPIDNTNSSQNTTNIGGLPCPNLGNSNFAVLEVYNILTGDVAVASDNTKTWWETQATDTDKVAITNFLLVKGYTQKNFDFIDNIVLEKQAGNLDITTSVIFTLNLTDEEYDWLTNQDDTNTHDFTMVNAILKELSDNMENGQIDTRISEFISYIINEKIEDINDVDFDFNFGNYDVLDEGDDYIVIHIDEIYEEGTGEIYVDSDCGYIT